MCRMKYILSDQLSDILEQMITVRIEEQGIAGLGDELELFLDAFGQMSVPKLELLSIHRYHASRD